MGKSTSSSPNLPKYPNFGGSGDSNDGDYLPTPTPTPTPGAPTPAPTPTPIAQTPTPTPTQPTQDGFVAVGSFTDPRNGLITEYDANGNHRNTGQSDPNWTRTGTPSPAPTPTGTPVGTPVGTTSPTVVGGPTASPLPGSNVQYPPNSYQGAAQADLEANLRLLEAQTDANRVNQTTPFGSSTWTKGPDGRWTQTVDMGSAGETANLRLAGELASAYTGYGMMTNPDLNRNALHQAQKDLDTSELPAWQQYNADGLPQVDYNRLTGMASNQQGMDPSSLLDPNSLLARGQGGTALNQNNLSGFGQAGGLLNSSNLSGFGQAGGVLNQGNLSGFGQAGSVLDQSKLGNTPQAGGFNMDPTGNSQAIQDATYKLLSPQRTEARNAEIQRLKNQGLTEDSPAFQRAIQRLDQGDTQAQLQALLAGQSEYGNAFNRGMGQNQQNYSQNMGLRGQLANEQNLQFNQQQANASLANQIRGQQTAEQSQQFGQQTTNANLANAIRGQQTAEQSQQFGQQNTNANLANAIRGQQTSEQNQQFGQNQSLAALADSQRAAQAAEQQQRYQQMLANTGLNNQALSTNFGQNLQAQNLVSQVRGQQFDENKNIADQGNALRGNMLDEQSKMNQYGLNVARGLLGQNSMQMPSFSGYAQQGNTASNQLEAYMADMTRQQNAANANAASNTNFTNGLFTLGASALGNSNITDWLFG